MAEKINLAEFNIDVESLTAAAAETVRAIEQIRKEQSAMRKEGKQTDEAFVRNAVTLRGLQKDYNAQIKVIENYMTSTGKQVPIQQRIDAALNKEAITIKDLRAQTSELIKIRNQANISTEEGQKQIAAINAQLDKNNATIKENVSDLEQQKIGIGGYADGIKEALGGTTLFGGAINDVNSALKQFDPVINLMKTDLNEAGTAIRNVTSGTEGMTAAQKASTVASNALSAGLKVLRIALISTGIGAVVVAFGALVSYLTATQEGIDRLNRVLTPLKAVFSGMIATLQDLGKVIVDVFTNPLDSAKELANFIKDQLITQFSALGRVLLGILTFDVDSIKQGFNELAENVRGHIDAVGGYFGKVSDRMGESWRAGQEIAALTERINASEIELTKNQARLNRAINENREIARDMALSQQERNVAAQKSIALAEELRDLEIGHQKMIVERLRMQQDLSGSTHSDNLEFAQEEAKLDEIQAKHAQDMIRLNSNLNSTRDKGNNNAQKAVDKRIQSLNEEMALWQAQQGFAARTIGEEIEMAQELADRRIAILDAELEAKKISQTKYNTELLNIQNDLIQQQSNAAVEAAQQELRSLDNRLAIEAQISEAIGDERIKLELEQAQKLSEAKADFELARFEAGLVNEQEYQNALDDIRRERLIAEDQAEREREQIYRERKKESADLMLEAELLGLEQRQAAIWEIEEFQINAQRERDLEAARQKYTDEALLAQAILNINQQAENAISELARVRMRERFEAKAEFLGAMASIFGEETAIGKAAGIAQATVNAYVGMTEALKLPWPLNLAAAASTLATGLSAVRSITSTKTDIKNPQKPSLRESSHPAEVGSTINAIPPFATGGLVTGGVPIKRSNGDNVLATLKKGEVVLNESQQRALGGAALFRHIGVPGFASGGLVGANTATLQRTLTSGINEQIAESIGEAVRQGARTGTEVGAHRGIMDLSTERYLGSITSF